MAKEGNEFEIPDSFRLPETYPTPKTNFDLPGIEAFIRRCKIANSKGNNRRGCLRQSLKCGSACSFKDIAVRFIKSINRIILFNYTGKV